jgi:hypothetical protein
MVFLAKAQRKKAEGAKEDKKLGGDSWIPFPFSLSFFRPMARGARLKWRAGS